MFVTFTINPNGEISKVIGCETRTEALKKCKVLMDEIDMMVDEEDEAELFHVGNVRNVLGSAYIEHVE